MQVSPVADISQQLGADRVLSPPGFLPQPADRLDASGPVRAHEIELAVERLCLDSTSYRNIREACGGDPGRMADRIGEIVAARGKMHNPETDSGGVLVGTVSALGEGFGEPPELGQRLVTMSSLTLTPLRLERVVELDPDSPQVDVRGSAYVFERASWAPLPAEMPLQSALEVLDVCAAASQVRELVPAQGTVCVLGAGHAGKLSMAAAREEMESGTIVAVDVDARARSRPLPGPLRPRRARRPARPGRRARGRARRRGAAGRPGGRRRQRHRLRADLDPARGRGGTVLFFSMATNFSAAALAGDGIGTEVRLRIGSGYAPDRGAYALGLVRSSAALREALGIEGRA